MTEREPYYHNGENFVDGRMILKIDERRNVLIPTDYYDLNSACRANPRKTFIEVKTRTMYKMK